MSIGIGARAKKTFEDSEMVIYEYGGFDLNDPKFRACIRDGSILIPRSCFVEPEIHTKRKKMKGGRKKLVVKRVCILVDYERMVLDGWVIVKNCGNCWRTMPDEPHADIMALCVLRKALYEYQETGIVPDAIYYFK